MLYAALEGPLFHVRAMRGQNCRGTREKRNRLEAGRCGNPVLRDDAPRFSNPGVAADQHLGSLSRACYVASFRAKYLFSSPPAKLEHS
jgi:hypothetical protein